MTTIALSGGPYGGEEHTFPADVAGTTLDLSSARPGRVERYELRANVDSFGEPVDGEMMAIFVGTVRP